MAEPTSRRIAVIGAGPGGLCTAIELKRAGYEDVVVLEQAEGVGGTWYHNRYPGAECDVMSHLYCFSFEPNPAWSRRYARQPEILAYLERVVDTYDLGPHLQLGTEVRSARWDDRRGVWILEREPGGALEVDVVVSAVGMFNRPARPDLAGLDRFAGTTIHTARWPDRLDLTDRRVAVVGSAASAVQLIPEIAPVVDQLTVYQRTATWVLPKDDRPYAPRDLDRFRDDPNAVADLRAALVDAVNSMMTFADADFRRSQEAAGLAHLAVVDDPDVRRRLTPTFPWGGRRPIVSNQYYPTFNRTNVLLVTDPIAEVTPDGIRTDDGLARHHDTIVLATGFEASRYLAALDVTGRDGLRLTEAWDPDPVAYLGVVTSGFPNLFMLYGPNTNNGSIMYMIECQVAYLVRQLQRMDDERVTWIDVHRDVMDRYNVELQDALDRVEVWQAERGGYYRGASGRIVTQWPHSMDHYCRLLADDRFDVFETDAHRPSSRP